MRPKNAKGDADELMGMRGFGLPPPKGVSFDEATRKKPAKKTRTGVDFKGEVDKRKDRTSPPKKDKLKGEITDLANLSKGTGIVQNALPGGDLRGLLEGNAVLGEPPRDVAVPDWTKGVAQQVRPLGATGQQFVGAALAAAAPFTGGGSLAIPGAIGGLGSAMAFNPNANMSDVLIEGGLGGALGLGGELTGPMLGRLANKVAPSNDARIAAEALGQTQPSTGYGSTPLLEGPVIDVSPRGNAVPLPGRHPGGALQDPLRPPQPNPDVLPPVENTAVTQAAPVVDTNQVRPLPRGPFFDAGQPSAAMRQQNFSGMTPQSLFQRPEIDPSLSTWNLGRGGPAPTTKVLSPGEAQMPMIEELSSPLPSISDPRLQNAPVRGLPGWRVDPAPLGPPPTQMGLDSLDPGLTFKQQPDWSPPDMTQPVNAPNLSRLPWPAEAAQGLPSTATMQSPMSPMGQAPEQTASMMMRFNQLSPDEQLALLLSALGLGTAAAAGGTSLYNAMQPPPPHEKPPVFVEPLPRAIQR